MERNLTAEQLALFEKEFASNPQYRVMQNAVTQTPVNAIALDRQVVTSIDHSVSHLLDDWKVTHQKKSGRCWLFAGLNLLRAGAAAKLGVKDFEFSQNYVLFWDKFERANFFLEAIIDTADRDADDRTVAHLLSDPIGDGGQWNMFIAVVRKHGLVPKTAMPETESSSSTAQMNDILRKVLRQGARDLRALDGAEARRDRKQEILTTVHRVLSIHLGTPPQKFLWQWKDSDKGFHRDGWTTPAEFAAEYVQLPVDDYVCLVHDPRSTSPVGKTFTVDYLGNVIDAPPVMPVTDAAVVANTAGGVLFVVGSEMTSRQAAARALEQLEHAKGRPIGAVLNRVDLDHNAYYYSQYYRREYASYYGVAGA